MTGDGPGAVAVAVNGARANAAEVWRASVHAGAPLTGAALGDRYGRSASWGRGVIAECRRVDGDGQQTAPDGDTPAPDAADTTSPAVRRVTALAVALVAVVAAAASYSHMHALALDAGEAVAMARILPLSVDGLVVAASMTLLSAHRAGRRAGVVPWSALLLGLGASLAANVAAAEPSLVGRLVAAWPPVALALSFELLLRQTRHR